MKAAIKDKLPALPRRDSLKLLRRMDTPTNRERFLPVVIGLGLLAVGAALWRLKPGALRIPQPAPLGDHANSPRWLRAAQRSRDGVAKIAPDNLSDSVGRSLVFAGGALLVTRLLDELTSER